MKKRIISAGVLALALSAGLSTPAHALMLADPAASNDATSRSIVHFGGGCTGTLIDSQWVLTANHCLPIVQNTQKVYIGPDMGNQEVISVKSIHETPKNAQGENTYDVGLVELSEPAKTIPAKLYQPTDRAPIGTQSQAYGWGNLNGAWENKIPTKESTIIESNFIPSKNYNFTPVTAKLDGEAKHVWGDSGGPLFIGDQLYGVLSGGSLEKEPHVMTDSTTAVYSPITELHNWFQQATGKDFFNGAHNATIDDKLEGVTYQFRSSDSFADSRDEELASIRAYLNGEITLDEIANSIYENLLPVILFSQYVDPIVGSNNDGEELTEQEKEEIKGHIEEIINDGVIPTEDIIKDLVSDVTDPDTPINNDDPISDNTSENNNDPSVRIEETGEVIENAVLDQEGNIVHADTGEIIRISEEAHNATTISEATPQPSAPQTVNNPQGSRGYTTISGGTSMTVDEVNEEGIKVETGGTTTTNIIQKFKNIFA